MWIVIGGCAMRILPTCTANVEFEWVGWTIHGGEQKKWQDVLTSGIANRDL